MGHKLRITEIYASVQGESTHAGKACVFVRLTGCDLRCSWCHVAVPHGWKNKGLLVNLNDVGPEAGLAPGTEVPINNQGQTYTQGPYYMNAKLKVRTWRQSGTWRDQDCGSAGGQQETGRDWMRNVCSNPP